MAKIKFNCPHCERSLAASPGMANKILDCPSCQKSLQVPQPKQQEGPSPKLATVRPPPPRQPECPYCGGQLAPGAVICVGCGRNLKTGQPIHTAVAAPAQPRVQGQSVVGSFPWGIVLSVLIAGAGWWGYTNFFGSTPLVSLFDGDREDDQFYEYSKVKAGNAKTIKEKVELLSGYMQKYPKGKHAGEVKALLEQAQEELAKWEAQMKVGSILADCRITLGSGQTISVQGWIQLIKVDESSVRACQQAIEDDVLLIRYKQLLEMAEIVGNENHKAENSRQYWSRVGEVMSDKLRGTVLAQGQLSEGKIEFTDLQPGYYLIYGAGLGGRNVVMYFDYLDVEAGKTSVTKKPFGSVFDADFVFHSWKPL